MAKDLFERLVALYERRPLVLYAYLAAMGVSFLLGYNGKILGGGLLAFFSTAILIVTAWEQEPVAKIRRAAFEPMPWGKVIGDGMAGGALLGAVWIAAYHAEFPLNVGNRVALALAFAVALSIEWEHWRRNGYARFPHLWVRNVESSIGSVLLTVGLTVLGVLPFVYVQKMLGVPDDWQARIVESIAASTEHKTLALTALGLLTELPLFLVMMIGAVIGWRRRMWLSERRLLHGVQRVAELAEGIGATLEWLKRINAFLQGVAVIGFVSVISLAGILSLPFLESMAMSAAKDANMEDGQLVFRLVLLVLTLIALSLVTTGLRWLLIAFDPKPSIPNKVLGAARLARSGDLRRTGISAP